ncbi:Allene oxide synthase 4 [Carex littledalei]|uniref:Allene oxide synthase 4 n=1 Tax=Carex littledalei TaxID=544730 RepID=A0A833QM10_9POAL|nr:Allene oxide synthase 4 [Carex littledalei]
MAKSSNGTIEEQSPSGLPIKSLPGSYGIPFLSPIYDCLHYFYFQGHMEYFKSHVAKNSSTVVRMNMAPGPSISRNSGVVAVLDAKSFAYFSTRQRVKRRTLSSAYTFRPSLSSRLTKFIPWPIEDLLLHCFQLPPFLARRDYEALEDFFSKSGESLLNDAAEKFGLSRHVALHNLIFMTSFNANGGFKIFMPIILKWLTHAGETLHGQLAHEIRSAVQSSNGIITFAALQKMELTKSVVWEALRLDP